MDMDSNVGADVRREGSANHVTERSDLSQHTKNTKTNHVGQRACARIRGGDHLAVGTVLRAVRDREKDAD